MSDRRTPFQFMRRQGINTAGGDGPPTWGDVVGVLSDQADLQTALDNKVNVGDDPHPQVANHAALPSAAAHTGEIYIVQTTTGLIGLRKLAGLWRSDGATWTYLGLYGRNASEITNVPGVGSSATDVQAAIDEIGGRSTDGWAEGVSNLYFTAARALGSVLTGFSTAPSVAVTAADTIVAAIGKLQAQINLLLGGGWTYVKLTTPALNSTITIVDTELAFLPEADSTYEIEAMLFVQSAATTTGVRLGWRWPTVGVSKNAADMWSPNSVTAYVSRLWGGTGNLNAAATGIGSANVNYLASGVALLKTSGTVTGSFGVTLASEIAASEVRAMEDSFIRYRKLP